MYTTGHMAHIYRILLPLCVGILFLGFVCCQSAKPSTKVLYLRLRDGSDPTNGRVEISKDNVTWGTVCDDFWDGAAADVVCRQLGLKWGMAHPLAHFGPGPAELPIVLDEVICDGSEESLLDCRTNPWGQNNCNHQEDAGVSCYRDKVRLTNAKLQPNVGSVEIFSDHRWAEVCSDQSWDNTDAGVVCRQLGYTSGRALSNVSKDSAEYEIWILYKKAYYNFTCLGNETTLMNCNRKRFSSSTCHHNFMAGVICYDTPLDMVNNTFDIRLSSGHYGTVEVHHLGVWGHVCYNDWGSIEASLACTHKGYAGGVMYGTNITVDKIGWMQHRHCDVSDTSLEACLEDEQGVWTPVFNCRAASVLCYKHSAPEISITDKHIGRVDITYDGQIGTICGTDRWTDKNAAVLCRQKGFADGHVLASVPKGKGKFYMSSVTCKGTEKSLLLCNNTGWEEATDPECLSHSLDVGVECYRHIRLSRQMSASTGFVEVYQNGSWFGLCGSGFTDVSARVACGQLGYENGKALPQGGYGKFYFKIVRAGLNCTGGENSILDCPYNKDAVCANRYHGYAVVSCFNGSASQDAMISLQSREPGKTSYGRLSVFRYNVAGQVCSSFWLDTNADVLCRSLGYKGGRATNYHRDQGVPIVVTDFMCKGTESALTECKEEMGICYSNTVAGAVCYNQYDLKVKLVGGDHYFGRVAMTIDDVEGLVCDRSWGQNEADVVCKELGFVSGEPYDVATSKGEVFLSDVYCTGTEASLIECLSSGWRSTDRQSCGTGYNSVGVYCFGNVRIVGGKKTPTFLAGRVEMIPANMTRWVSVCADGFHQTEAEIVCREIGFSSAQVLAPGSFGSINSLSYVSNTKCNGSESSFRDCVSDTQGICVSPSYNYASILCTKADADPDTKVYLTDGYHGMVLVERYGINGTICADGWDESDANVTCRSFGYAGGVVLGPPEVYSRGMPVWYTDFQCVGTENHLTDCDVNTSIPLNCMQSIKNAGVLCYNGTGVQVRLAGGKRHYGRVEVSYDGTWGTICDYDWTKYDARVLCKQLGFSDGRSYKQSYYGPGTGPVYLSGMFCDSSESSLLSCPSRGWNKAQYYCKQHGHDASAYCYRPVSSVPGEDYGGLQVWNKNSYGMVCSDGFDDLDATMACRDMGYGVGVSLCCSAFGDVDFMLARTNIQCTGREVSLADCPSDKGVGYCDSGTYASVVCSDKAPSLGYGLTLENGHFGRVQVKYFDHDGYICAEDFDDNDANVICKQAGFLGGFSYLAKTKEKWVLFSKDIRWLRNLNCNGTETHMEQCGKLNWGNVGKCSQKKYAAAFCYLDKDKVGHKLELVGGKTPSEGLVKIKINGTWGTMCALSVGNSEATVLCRQKGYTYGVYLTSSTTVDEGPVWISAITCLGNESSIYECMVDSLGEEPMRTCSSHKHDVSIKCYSNVRLSGSAKLSNYGQLQVYNGTGWYSICDKGFGELDARIACQSMGYQDGRAQCCSALGNKFPSARPVGITDVQCILENRKFSDCSHSYGTCETGHYVTLVCLDNDTANYSMEARVPDSLFYGPVEVQRYGIWGSVCDTDWDYRDATVLCRELGYKSGNASKEAASSDIPTVLGSVHCNGTEKRLRDCPMTSFTDDHLCNGRNTRAAVVCSKDNGGVQFRIGDEVDGSGRAELLVNGQWGSVCNRLWDDRDADVFCRQLPDYVGGMEVRPRLEAARDVSIWMTHVDCHGNETNFLDCKASWGLSKTRYCNHGTDAGVACFKSVRLNRGNYKNNGILEVYQQGSWGTVCSSGFHQTEADVACRSLHGYQHGMPLCCTPYGYSFRNVAVGRFECGGQENHLTDCNKTQVYRETGCHSQDYTSIVCYNGTRTKDYSIQLVGSSSYTGQVNLTYLGVEGRICVDGWDDADAKVVCHELGYPNGMAYHHYKSDLVFFEYSGPYWTSKVNCTGNESRLSECPHVALGQVKSCVNNSYAGVLCYNNDGIYYELMGGDNRYGYINVSVRGQWGTICGRYWDRREADVLCRQLGYSTGDPRYGPYNTMATGTVWEANFRCRGKEDSLNKCSHEGWMVSQSQSCLSHKDDAGVFCYTNVKLSNGFGKLAHTGAVMLYRNNTWLRVCDTGFNDQSARLVCQELGYTDGRAMCCSAYGRTTEQVQTNYTLRCSGQEKSVPECLREEKCVSDQYASVVCFHKEEAGSINEGSYTFKLEDKSKGQVLVDHLDVQGRICGSDWDDNDAKVVCRRQGYQSGIAYLHDENSVMEAMRGPYWLSGFNCTGNEASLINCPHNTQLSLGNCTTAHIASVLCYNETGLTYRLNGGGKNYGRVEIAIDNTWGTVCDAYWDNREANVLCRQLNFTEGVAIAGAAYGMGKGAIWLSHLQCTGREDRIHHCPHRGFNDQFTEASWLLPVICDSHRDDASVFCYQNVRLNEGYNSPMGGLEIYKDDQWYGVCDEGFTNLEAKVACISLGLNYVDGRAINGSAFGNLTGPIGFTHMKCRSGATDITKCYSTSNGTCKSKMYASVYCSNTTVVDTGFKVRIAPDSLASQVHGILEVRQNGIWGRVCMHEWDDRDANVACKHQGYAGGLAYLHIMKNRRPIMLRSVRCKGTEDKLTDCPHNPHPDLDNCNFNSNDAGILCYKKTGMKYRLNTRRQQPSSEGRVEIFYDGVWGTVCSWSWQSADAKVLCRQLGYQDGIVSYNVEKSLPQINRWVTGFFCQGNEKTMMTCLNTGFNSSFLDDLCMFNEPGAYSACYNRTVKPTSIHLIGGPDRLSGRVEVYIKGPNQWGTICDDFWDDLAANVVCRQLNFAGGKAVKDAAFGRGTGPIWFDNVRCLGNESTIFECSHRGIGTHNCNHTEDVGVMCWDHPLTTMSPQTAMTTTTSLPKTTRAPTTTALPKTTRAPPTTARTTTTTRTTPRTTTRPTILPFSTTSTPTTTIVTTTTPKPTTTTSTTTTSTTTTSTTLPPSTTTTTITSTTTTTSEPTIVTTENVTIDRNLTVSPHKSEQSEVSGGAIAAFTVVIIVILTITILAVVCFVKVRKLRKAKVPHERFHDDIIEHSQDGSLAMSNQMYDVTVQPSANGYHGDAQKDNNVTLSSNGDAVYTKPSAGQSDSSHAFANPLYDQMKTENISGNKLEALPENKELELHIVDSHA
ncbi:deleted in malignant brain tumors 1 protein-like [Mizuhopecten yessoensis]|uniref:deleted in malignant brain tumors 1 protein-like n=1 Tax=Mizuhopecten yessoensis TaxID=6573 RepID=UPI000B45AF40|nr:deleted in malignant brain tumors 1 protein-like [Mizuhopecten yessoensis]